MDVSSAPASAPAAPTASREAPTSMVSGQNTTPNTQAPHATKQHEGHEQSLAAEQPVEEVVKEDPSKEEDPRFGPKFAALARREKMLRDRESQLKTQEAEYRAWREAKENAKKNPMAVLEQHGLSFDEVTDYLLSDGKPKELTVEDKIAALEKKLAEKEQAELAALEAAQVSQVEQQINEYKKGIEEFVNHNVDTYELIKVNEAQDLVFQVVEEHYHANGGEVLRIEDACRLVEEHLEKEMERIANLKKFKTKYQTPVSQAPTPPAPQSNAPRTLTNSQNAFTPAPSPRQFLSDDESKRQAAALLKWN